MNKLGFNITDISTGQKLEALLLRLTKEMDLAKADYLARINLVQKQIDTLGKSVSTTQSRLTSVEGAYATAFRTSPADVQVYDEQTQQWISSSGDTTTFAGNLLPAADDTYDVGIAGSEWRNLNIDGTANIDSLVADTADINGGTVDNATVGATTQASGKFTTLQSTGAFGCNNAAVQTPYASGGALDAYVTGAFGMDSDAHMTALYNLVVAIRAALVANGIMS